MEPRHAFVEANGIRFHYVEQGGGPLVLLLHGFPEFWYSWRKQLPALAEAGFRAVAPDMRGYNLSDKPRDGYNIESLVNDVVALGRTLGDERVHVVGHDWGGVVAWQTAWRQPEFVRTLVVLNAPHPTVFARRLPRDARQMLRSSYMLFFQLSGIAEWALTRNRASAVARALRASAKHPEVFSDGDVAAYREAFLRPGVARASLNYYRQVFRQRWRVLPSTPIVAPTLVLWGADDPVLRPGMNEGLEEWVKNLTFRRIAECGHWTQQEQPSVVNSALVEWLRAHASYP